MSVKRKKKASRERIQGVVVGKIELVWEIWCECGGVIKTKPTSGNHTVCSYQPSTLQANTLQDFLYADNM